jgi:hypothetical protein
LISAGWTCIVIDQFNKPIETVRRRGWPQIGSDPTVDVKSSTKRVTVLGAITHEGESVYCWTEENLTAAHGVRLLGALQAQFGEEIVVCLDQASYFSAKDLWNHVSDEKSTETIEATWVERVAGTDLQVWYFPLRLPQ